MVARRGYTLRARWLGQRLRALREKNRLTLKHVADQIQRDVSAVSRLESGIHPARVPEVLAYVSLCRVSTHDRDALVTFAQDVWRAGWWEGFTGEIPEPLADLLWLESRAAVISTFQVGVLPDLLQTRQYAEAVTRDSDPDAPADRIASGVELRALRQRILTGEHPVRLTAVLDESLLHRRVGGADVLRAQLTRLHELSCLPHVEIRVLPFSAEAAPAEGMFEVIGMREPYTDVVHVRTPAEVRYYTDHSPVSRLTDHHHRLMARTLDPTASRDRIAAAIDRLPT